MTEWRTIEEFPDYLVNEYGDIMNSKRGRTLHSRPNEQDFLMVGLVRDRVQYTRTIAPFVAKAFLEPPRSEAYCSVIHLNGDWTDCRASNLMWRPRWFVPLYRHMFEEMPYRIGVNIPAINRRYTSLREVCTTYGLVESSLYSNMVNREPCFHYGWFLEEI